jgi:hypothetical protein
MKQFVVDFNQNRYCLVDRAKQQPSRTQSRSKKVEHQVRSRKDDAAIIIRDDLLMEKLSVERLKVIPGITVDIVKPVGFSGLYLSNYRKSGVRNFYSGPCLLLTAACGSAAWGFKSPQP